jgi:hypothetical protein
LYLNTNSKLIKRFEINQVIFVLSIRNVTDDDDDDDDDKNGGDNNHDNKENVDPNILI